MQFSPWNCALGLLSSCFYAFPCSCSLPPMTSTSARSGNGFRRMPRPVRSERRDGARFWLTSWRHMMCKRSEWIHFVLYVSICALLLLLLLLNSFYKMPNSIQIKGILLLMPLPYRYGSRSQVPKTHCCWTSTVWDSHTIILIQMKDPHGRMYNVLMNYFGCFLCRTFSGDRQTATFFQDFLFL